MSTAAADMTDVIAAREERDGHANVTRDETIKAIRAALKRRTGLTWSVTGGRGTAYGWITITAPPKRRTGQHVEDGVYPEGDPREGQTRYKLIDSGVPGGYMMNPQDMKVLADALGLEQVHHQGETVPASTDYRVEYIARAEGRTPSRFGAPYWD